MIRLILVAVALISFLIISLPIQLCIFLLEKAGIKWADTAALRICQGCFKLLLFLSGVKITVKGRENLPSNTGVLYIGNHNSYFDIVTTYSIMPTLTGFIAKKELEKLPGINIWMHLLHCYFLDRSNLKAGMKMITDSADRIKNGISMVIFPEGTRNKSGDERNLLPFKEGSFKIAEKAGCPIIPMAITGTADIWEKQLPFIKSSRVTIEFGKPFDVMALEKPERKTVPGLIQGQVLELIEKNKQ